MNYHEFNERKGLEARIRVAINRAERLKARLPFEGTLYMSKYDIRSRLSEARVYNNGSAVSTRLAGLGVR